MVELLTCHPTSLPRFCKHWVASSLGKHQPCILLTCCATDFIWVLSVLLKIQSQREGSGGSHLSGATHPDTYSCWQGCLRGPHLSGATHSGTYRGQAGHLREWVGLGLRHRDTGLAHWNYMERPHITHPAKKCMLSHFSQAPDLALIFPQWVDSGMWHDCLLEVEQHKNTSTVVNDGDQHGLQWEGDSKGEDYGQLEWLCPFSRGSCHLAPVWFDLRGFFFPREAGDWHIIWKSSSF